MTGSVFNRQLSSTAGCSTKTKISRPKLRRWSSADEHNSFDITPDCLQEKEQFIMKRSPSPADSDSGIEDFDQQIAIISDLQTSNVNEQESPSFDPCEDDELVELTKSVTNENVDNDSSEVRQFIDADIALAANVLDTEKKDFCADTREVFHGEFARLIGCPIALAYPGVHYYLHAEDDVPGDPCDWAGFSFVKLDNAKAQFKCTNHACSRLWTSMRSRISFKISHPHSVGFVVLKIYGQDCTTCGAPADPLWYVEEVCRVMKNLAREIFVRHFSGMVINENALAEQMIPSGKEISRRSRHDPFQRKGKMNAPHNAASCEACRRGWCYA